MTIRHLPGLKDRWYVHTLNYGEEKGRPIWRHGALWLHGPRTEAHAEWTVGSPYQFGIGFELGRNGGESDVGLTLHFSRLGSLYLRLRAPWTSRARVRPGRPSEYTPRKTGILLWPREQTWIEVKWEDTDGEWTRGQPWWRCWSFGRRQFFGRTRTTTTTTDEGETVIPLPEGQYPATWKREVSVTQHMRWPGSAWDRFTGMKRRDYVSLSIEGGIPIEGKGENSWDCGMDGLFGCGGRTVEAAVGNAVGHVLEGRQRHGGPHDLIRPTTVAELSR